MLLVCNVLLDFSDLPSTLDFVLSSTLVYKVFRQYSFVFLVVIETNKQNNNNKNSGFRKRHFWQLWNKFINLYAFLEAAILIYGICVEYIVTISETYQVYRDRPKESNEYTLSYINKPFLDNLSKMGFQFSTSRKMYLLACLLPCCFLACLLSMNSVIDDILWHPSISLYAPAEGWPTKDFMQSIHLALDHPRRCTVWTKM